jgi:hypothetical protein
MSTEIEILGASKRQRFVKLTSAGDLYINWEVYGDGEGSRDMETTIIVSSTEFSKMNKRYGFNETDPILKVLQKLSDDGRGDEFIDDLRDGAIEIMEKHVF